MTELTFRDCLFNREVYADSIIFLIKNCDKLYNDQSLVIGLDLPWGFGKTTFIRAC